MKEQRIGEGLWACIDRDGDLAIESTKEDQESWHYVQQQGQRKLLHMLETHRSALEAELDGRQGEATMRDDDPDYAISMQNLRGFYSTAGMVAVDDRGEPFLVTHNTKQPVYDKSEDEWLDAYVGVHLWTGRPVWCERPELVGRLSDAKLDLVKWLRKGASHVRTA